jgi:hypothetical protein
MPSHKDIGKLWHAFGSVSFGFDFPRFGRFIFVYLDAPGTGRNESAECMSHVFSLTPSVITLLSAP